MAAYRWGSGTSQDGILAKLLELKLARTGGVIGCQRQVGMPRATARSTAIRDEPIRRYSEFQKNWAAVIEPLRRGKFVVEDTNSLSIHGDAPKNFIWIQRFSAGRPGRRLRNWPGYIAKVGSKSYPNESITEHLLTRIGQAFRVRVAESMLRIVGRQVRFLSKYFLSRRRNYLVHGIEIFKEYLDEGLVQEIAEARAEQDFYTFQTVSAAMKGAFSAFSDPIMAAFVEMLAFDAIVGNNDRHPANWGVVVPVQKGSRPYFAPIFDTARALFWNCSEKQVARIVSSQESLRGYVDRSRPQIGWDGWDGTGKVGHFDLISGVYQDFPEYRLILDRLKCYTPLNECANLLAEEFSELMTACRRQAIVECLRLRHQLYVEAIS